MTKKIKLSVGDIFRFKGVGDYWGFGQILLSNILQYVAIFEPNFMDNTTIYDVVKSNPLLSGWTMDGRFYSGDWKIIGNALPVKNFIFPKYKVGISGKTWVTDVHGKPLRLALPSEERQLNFQKSYSPVTFEKAFKAHHGTLPWETRFDELLT